MEALSAEAVQYDGREQEIPTLLRFINMIINDATLQLDEGLEVWSTGVWASQSQLGVLMSHVRWFTTLLYINVLVCVCVLEPGVDWRAAERGEVRGMAVVH